MNKFDKIEIGHRDEFTHTVTEEDVQKFCELTGDDNPLHMDEEYAFASSFRGRVVHGMLTASFLSKMIGTRIPGHGSLWLSQSLQFLMPVRIGDTLRVIAKVKDKSPAMQIVTLETEIRNQDDQVVLTGEAKVKVLEEKKRPKAEVRMNRGAAIITGASRGIGAAVATKLSKDGFGVIIDYHTNKKEAESVLDKIVESGGRGIVYRADVRDGEEVEKMVQEARKMYGAIDVLVNNASGPILPKDFEQLEWEDIQNHLDLQLKGVFNTCKAVIPIMKAQRRGKIINVGSIFSDNVPPAKLHGYIIAKSALNALTKTLAVEYGPSCINVNCVSPGMTETTLIANVPEKTKMVTAMQTPLRRLSTPNDVSEVISFLASDAANYLTGETIRVCGGQLML